MCCRCTTNRLVCDHSSCFSSLEALFFRSSILAVLVSMWHSMGRGGIETSNQLFKQGAYIKTPPRAPELRGLYRCSFSTPKRQFDIFSEVRFSSEVVCRLVNTLGIPTSSMWCVLLFNKCSVVLSAVTHHVCPMLPCLPWHAMPCIIMILLP